MAQNRRIFLKALGAGMAVLSLPEVSPFLNYFCLPGSSDEDLVATLERLLLGREPGGPFVAQAKTYLVEAEPYKLLGAPAALLAILDEMGLDRRFSNCMAYHEASQCRSHFESQEAKWRGNNFNSFTGVKRPRSDHDVAIAVGGDIDTNSNLVHAAGATQYQNFPAVSLDKLDPDVTRAVSLLLGDNLSSAEGTQSMAVIDKRDVTIENSERATRYETPVSSSVYIPHARRTSRVNNAVGLLAANSKSAPNKIYIADVYG